MDLSLFLELAINGALSGLMYSLVALGIVLIYKSSSVPNLAQGALAMLGAFVALAVFEWLKAPMWVALPVAMVRMFLTMPRPTIQAASSSSLGNCIRDVDSAFTVSGRKRATKARARIQNVP